MIYLLTLVLAVAVFAWRTIALGYRDQNALLKQKNEGYKSALLAYMMYRYRDLAKIEKLESELKVCEFVRGK